jgi:hypothetical protein
MANTLLIEFALVYSPDCFVVPNRMEGGNRGNTGNLGQPGHGHGRTRNASTDGVIGGACITFPDVKKVHIHLASFGKELELNWEYLPRIVWLLYFGKDVESYL